MECCWFQNTMLLALFAVFLVVQIRGSFQEPCLWRPSASCQDSFNQNSGYFRREFCQITEVPDDIPSAAKIVYLTGNCIQDIPSKIFSNLSQCTHLICKKNPISTIHPGAFCGLKALLSLDLGLNEIMTMESGVWEGLGLLESLGLTGNKISALQPGMFEGLTSLSKLGLNSNKISIIAEGAFSGLPNLQQLRLANNKLKFLSPGPFADLPRPLTLALSRPEELCPVWDCDSMHWLKVEEEKGNILWYYSAWQDSPPEFQKPKCREGFLWDEIQPGTVTLKLFHRWLSWSFQKQLIS